MEVSSVVITIDEMKIHRPKLLSWSALLFDLNLIKRFRRFVSFRLFRLQRETHSAL